MHRISRNQDKMLKDLQHQAREVRNVAKEEHRLVKEIHPKVHDIAESLEVADGHQDDPSSGSES